MGCRAWHGKPGAKPHRASDEKTTLLALSRRKTEARQAAR